MLEKVEVSRLIDTTLIATDPHTLTDSTKRSCMHATHGHHFPIGQTGYLLVSRPDLIRLPTPLIISPISFCFITHRDRVNGGLSCRIGR